MRLLNVPAYARHDDKFVCGFFGQYSFLSNFWPCRVMFEGRYYMSSEAAYQAAKTDVPHIREKFEKMGAGKSKRQQVPMRPEWESVKVSVMRAVVLDKFQRNPCLRRLLLATGQRHLEEANHWGDVFWGTSDGRGLNTLGIVLMETRPLVGGENLPMVTQPTSIPLF